MAQAGTAQGMAGRRGDPANRPGLLAVEARAATAASGLTVRPGRGWRVQLPRNTGPSTHTSVPAASLSSEAPEGARTNNEQWPSVCLCGSSGGAAALGSIGPARRTRTAKRDAPTDQRLTATANGRGARGATAQRLGRESQKGIERRH